MHLLTHNIKMAVFKDREISKNLSVSALRTVLSETVSLGFVFLRLHPGLTRAPAPARVPCMLLHHRCKCPHRAMGAQRLRGIRKVAVTL